MKTRRYLYFPGCKLEPFLPRYDRSVRRLMTALGIELVALELNCCGYPIRDQEPAASMLAAARNMALAAREGQALMTPCKCCYGQLQHTAYWLQRNEDLRRYVNAHLETEGLTWVAGGDVFHLLQVLAVEIGDEIIRAGIRQPLNGLRIAAHYGCHALRPGHITRFDNPLAPTLFENLVETTGARAVHWPLRLECCGRPLKGKNDHLAGRLMQRKIKDAREAGAHVLATACTHCQMQFDHLDGQWTGGADEAPLPQAMLYSQVLEQAMGLKGAEQGRVITAMQGKSVGG